MRTLLVTAMLLAASLAYGQTSPQITLSTEKVKVSGEVVYVHKVKGGETLYSLAKAYNVTIDDIVRRNESLKGGLKEGSVIYIPSKGTAKVEEPSVQPATAAATAATAPAPAGQDWSLTPANIKKYSKKKHTVKWYEKIGDIARKYNVPVEDIIAFNNLGTTELKKKQVLYIPNNEFLAMAAQSNEEKVEILEEKADEIPDSTGKGEPAAVHIDKVSDIAFILPLNLRDTLGPNSNFMDFYTGALIAIDDMKGSGSASPAKMQTEITLIDQQMYGSMEELISSGALDGKDAIIGPVKPADIEKVLDATAGKSLVFSPMDQASEGFVDGNPHFCQVPPSVKAQQEDIVKLFAGKCTPGSNAVLIYEKGGVDTTFLGSTQRILDTAGVTFSTLSYGILEGREILEKMVGIMKPEVANMVLVLSSSEAFVSDVVRNLNLIHTNPMEENRREIVLFGLPRWSSFGRIEVDYFHKMNLHLSLPYFVDYSREEVKDFLMKYRALTNSEPTPFAFQGYDIAAFACGTLAKDDKLPVSLQITNRYIRNGAGNGLVNCGTINIIYNNDYTVSVVE